MTNKGITCEKLVKRIVVDSYDDIIVKDAKEVLSNWDSMTDEEKQGWYTSSEERYRVDADSVFDSILKRLRSWECLGEDASEFVNSVAEKLRTKDNTEKLQGVLDEIFDVKVLSVYFPEDPLEEYL